MVGYARHDCLHTVYISSAVRHATTCVAFFIFHVRVSAVWGEFVASPVFSLKLKEGVMCALLARGMGERGKLACSETLLLPFLPRFFLLI
jgi:hypothetical protein